MNQNINKLTGKPIKVLWFGDLVVLSGFGRIGNEVTLRLKQRGYDVQGIGISYSGWPHGLPFWIWPLSGQDLWNGLVTIVNQQQPDVLISCQDFPYHQTIWNGCRIDFSKIKWIWITPIDGTPIHPEWMNLCKWADGKMAISRFGVEALRQVGQKVSLCQPGINPQEFYPAPLEERNDLRGKAGYSAGDFIVGVVAVNQGRKAIPPMIQAFHEFAKDKPNARLYLDMDRISPAGWDIPNLLIQQGWTDEERKRVRFKDDLWAYAAERSEQPEHAMLPLRNRYVIMDAHMVISHREGFGLPLLESMACRVPTIALDYCSGPEICGEGRGYLIPKIDYMEYGTWGGARDAFPDISALTRTLETVYCYPEQATAIAATGYEWARQQTWDRAADAVEAEIQSALKHQGVVSHEPITRSGIETNLSDDRAPAAAERSDTVIQPTRNVAALPEEPVPDIVGVRAEAVVRDYRTG